ncbi:MAG: hypothetical protein ACYDBV_01800 [Nitrospiria bacterium]
MGKAYLESIEQVMNDFVEQILNNADKLNLTSEEKIWTEINEGFPKLKADSAISIPKNASLWDEANRAIYDSLEPFDSPH